VQKSPVKTPATAIAAVGACLSGRQVFTNGKKWELNF